MRLRQHRKRPLLHSDGMSHIAHRPALIAFFTVFLIVTAVRVSSQQRRPSTHQPARHAPVGRQIFTSNCVGCHGLDGTGSQRAPNIVTNPQLQKLSATELFRIISAGVPGTGMPAFQHLGKPAITSLVSYLKDLQGKNHSAPLPGDPKRGEALFFTSAQCSTCHMAAGKGGFIAPDLSSYGQTHAAEKIKSAITNPAERDSIKAMVTAITSSGERYQGMIRNEDNFSLQLQSTDGAFHFLSKAELKAIERGQGSLMPPDYASKLSEAQLNDIASFLLKLGNTSIPADIRAQDGE